jgi:HAD superfamily hydrolase (TIGR01490 family)
MDGTLVRVNTGSLWLAWEREHGRAGPLDSLRVLSWLLQYRLGIVDVRAVTRAALRSLVGKEESALREESVRWYRERVRPHVTDEARREVEKRRAAGDVVAILSASTPYATGPLAADLGIEHVLCTRLEVGGDGRFTGGWHEPLSYGDGKVAVAEAWAAEHGVDLATSAFYTDSISDLPMLERVGEPRVVNPDPRLRFWARRRKLEVVKWI